MLFQEGLKRHELCNDMRTDSCQKNLPRQHKTSLVAKFESLSNGGHNIVRHVAAVKHVTLAHVTGILGNISERIGRTESNKLNITSANPIMSYSAVSPPVANEMQGMM